MLEAAIQHRRGLCVSLKNAEGLVRRELLDGAIQVAIETSEYIDAVGSALMRVVGETEAIVKFSARKADAGQCRDEEHGAEPDALGIDGHRPVRQELVARRPDAEGSMLDDEKPRLPVKLALYIHDPTVPQPRATLDVQLSSEPRAHVGDDVPLASPERLGAPPRPPPPPGFI